MTSFDGSIECAALLYDRDKRLASMESKLGKMHQSLLELMRIHCHKNTRLFNRIDRGSWITQIFELTQAELMSLYCTIQALSWLPLRDCHAPMLNP